MSHGMAEFLILTELCSGNNHLRNVFLLQFFLTSCLTVRSCKLKQIVRQQRCSNSFCSHFHPFLVHHFMIFDLFSGGQMIDFLQESFPKPLPFHQMLKSFAQTCMAVSHMHKQSPPVIHRDLKVNTLVDLNIINA